MDLDCAVSALPLQGTGRRAIRPSSKPVPFLEAGVFAGVVLLSLGWAAYTQHVWEDFYITYRASKNLALGDGLVFTVGDRLQTFTSPLQALIPAAIAWATHCRSDTLVLWIYRYVGAIALGCCSVNLLRISRHEKWPAPTVLACIGLFAVDAKILDFTASGMETPFLLFFLCWQAQLVITGASGWKLGLAWAGMMMSRPDAFIQIGAFYMALMVFGNAGSTRREFIFKAVRGALVAAVLYLPWVLWANSYYGSPVPNTIIAKGLYSPHGAAAILESIVQAPLKAIACGNFLRFIFAPTYLESGTMSDWGLASNCGWLLLSVPVWCYWLNPWGSRMARTMSLWLFLDSIYEVCAPAEPWYLPPYTLVALIAWGYVITDLVERVRTNGTRIQMPTAHTLRRMLLWIIVAAITFQARTACLMAFTMRQQQILVEDSIRHPLGLWLRENGSPGDTVFLECLGYIGYYSNLKMYDFPGLSSREVVAARIRLKTDEYGALIRELKPVWLVLRPEEARRVNSFDASLLKGEKTSTYVLARSYDQSPALNGMRGIPGYPVLDWDKTFLVFHTRH
jgi:hypothetical protein